MFALITLIQNSIQTYTDSLRKDLAEKGFEVILLIVSSVWFSGILFLLTLIFLGRLQFPTDTWFYVFWAGVAILYTIQFTFFITGLKHALFLAANVFPNLSFLVTTAFAVVLLHESISSLHIIAIIIALAGSLLFFEWRPGNGLSNRRNKGLFFIICSVIVSPLIGICYKAASLHTSSYAQFLTGRLSMDIAYYTLFFTILFGFWYRSNPFPKLVSMVKSGTGLTYLIVVAFNSLLGSWLIFKLPISLIALLGAISIPAGYVIGAIKYREHIQSRYVVGGILILVAVALTAIK